MSLKKDKSKSKDKIFMNLALNLAKQRVGLTGQNPSVGCVIVKNNEILSFGQTSLNGRPHAEYNAIKHSKKKIDGSTMYVSLEPCSHYGKTPPCTKLIAKSKIKKLFYAINDVDIRSSNKAYKFLKSKNILVKKFLFKKKAENIYKSYFFSKKKNTPYVVGKLASSKDNFISSSEKYITNEHSRKISHLLRYKNQAILISSTTLNNDNPKLSCRLPGLQKYSPIRIILDKNLKSKKNSYIIKSCKNFKTYFFYNCDNSLKKNFFIKSGATLFKTPLDEKNQLDLSYVLKKINIIGINNLLVEGGKHLTTSFLNANFFNEFYLFKSNNKLGKKGRKKISKILNILQKSFNFKKNVDTYMDKDKLINYY